jgi:uncharacterized membrane protein
MVFLALLTLAMVVFLVAAVWSALSEEANDGKEAGPAKDSARAREVARPETLEGVLVRQLVDGEISGPQYRRAMRRLAERDADRHPMTVPPEN